MSDEPILKKVRLNHLQWQLDYLNEILPELERKEKGEQTPDDKVVESVRSKLERKFKDVAELYALQAEVMAQYKNQVNVNKSLLQRIDRIFRKEIEKLVEGEDE